MQDDLFATVRKRDTGVSTSFRSETPQHDAAEAATPREPQETAEKTPKHEKHHSAGGSGRQAPNRDRPVTVPEILPSDNDRLPADWRSGLIRLNEMRAPNAATATRWRQIIIDTHRLAWGWRTEAEAAGWSVASLVGYAPKDPDGAISLALDVRGGRIVGLRTDERGRAFASILQPDGSYRAHYSRMPDDAPPIWALGL